MKRFLVSRTFVSILLLCFLVLIQPVSLALARPVSRFGTVARSAGDPTNIKLVADGKDRTKDQWFADPLKKDINTTLTLKATWDGGKLEDRGWWLDLNDSGTFLHRCESGSSCTYEFSEKAEHHAIYYATISWYAYPGTANTEESHAQSDQGVYVWWIKPQKKS